MASKLRELQHVKKYDLVFGAETTNPFDPPRQMPCHAGSVALLLLSIQRRRREQQTLVEVGSFQGVLARWVLNCCPNATMHLVDPWQTADPDSSWYKRGDRFAKLPQEQFDAYHDLCAEMATQFNAGLAKPRVFLHRKPSLEAANEFADGSQDLVFLDAAHDGENVRKDILAWHSKVRAGGYLSGHDFKWEGNYFGLVDAVKRTTAELGLTIQVFPGKVWHCLIPG